MRFIRKFLCAYNYLLQQQQQINRPRPYSASDRRYAQRRSHEARDPENRPLDLLNLSVPLLQHLELPPQENLQIIIPQPRQHLPEGTVRIGKSVKRV